MSEAQDQQLTCADCGGKFLWSTSEQEFYREKGFQQPQRCKECRQARKERRGDAERKGDRG
jgi:hypothetical protein